MRGCSGTLANIKHERLAFFLPIQGLLQKRHPGTLFFHECRQEQIDYRTDTECSPCMGLIGVGFKQILPNVVED